MKQRWTLSLCMQASWARESSLLPAAGACLQPEAGGGDFVQQFETLYLWPLSGATGAAVLSDVSVGWWPTASRRRFIQFKWERNVQSVCYFPLSFCLRSWAAFLICIQVAPFSLSLISCPCSLTGTLVGLCSLASTTPLNWWWCRIHPLTLRTLGASWKTE